MEEKNLFAENLKFLRSKNGMEQLDLAKRLGRKSSSSISEWEKGKYTPKAGVLNDIARIFNVSLSELMSTDIANPENTTSEPTIVKGFNTEEAITTEAWRSLYQIIEMERNHEIEEEIIATSNVESPGDINLQAIGQFISENHWMFQSGLLAIAALFGDVDIKGVKFKGLFPYLHTRAMQQLDERQKTVEVETLEKDAELKDILREIDIEKARKELQAIRNIEITVDSPSVHYADEYQTRMDFDDSPGEG